MVIWCQQDGLSCLVVGSFWEGDAGGSVFREIAVGGSLAELHHFGLAGSKCSGGSASGYVLLGQRLREGPHKL